MSFIDSLIETDRTHPKRILILGDGILDVYVNGRVEPCQDGCEKFVEDERISVPGGAANAAQSLQHWSAKCTFFYNNLPRPVKTRFMNNGGCIFRYDSNEQEHKDNFVLTVARARALRCVKSKLTDAVLLSDYDKGFLTPEFIRQVIDTCKDQGIPVVADVKREPLVYIGAVMKCNNDWYNRYQREMLEWQETPVVRTFGGETPDVYLPGPEPWPEIPRKPPVQCVNHVGAGDCFAAHLTLALAYGCGFLLSDAVAFAHSAGRVYVQHPYNRPPWPEEIKRDMEMGA